MIKTENNCTQEISFFRLKLKLRNCQKGDQVTSDGISDLFAMRRWKAKDYFFLFCCFLTFVTDVTLRDGDFK